MDIFIYIALVVVIGLFFFLDKYTKTQNSMFIIIILSFLGFVILQNSSVELVDYTHVEKINATNYQYSQIDIASSGMGLFNVQSFLVLVYWFFMIVAVINLIIGKGDK